MLIDNAQLIPDWLKNEIKGPCPYCGSEYEVGYSPNNSRVTKHYCPNRYCPGTVAMKMAFMFDILGISGYKFKKCLSLINSKDIKNHVEGLKYVLDNKPNINLDKFMRINCIRGIDDNWSNICKNKESLDDVLESNEVRNIITDIDRKDIMEAKEYVNINIVGKKKYEPVVTMTIMMTGDIMGLENREYLAIALNEKYKGLLDLRYSKNKRKTNITALIKEEGSPITGKVSVAKEAGIPIMTPREFILYVDKVVKERAGDLYNDI